MGDPARFLAAFRAKPELKGDAHSILNVVAMAACFSPSGSSPYGFDLPMDLRTGERIEAVWDRWLAFDPVHVAEARVDALRSLELLHLEAGLRDEFHLQFGLRRLVRELERLRVPFRHEEHEGGHFGIDDRYLAVLPRVVDALASPRA